MEFIGDTFFASICDSINFISDLISLNFRTYILPQKHQNSPKTLAKISQSHTP